MQSLKKEKSQNSDPSIHRVDFRPPGKRPYVLLAGVTVVFLCLAFGLQSFFSLEKILIASEYYFLWATLIVGAAIAGECFDLSLLVRKKDLRIPLFTGFVLTSIVFAAIGARFRILADETNLIACSMSFYLERTFKLITQGLSYFDMYHIVSFDPPIRPGLYPFFISILHSLIGYNANHGFAVNFIVGVFFGASVFYYCKKHLGTRMAIFTCLLAFSFPLFALSLTSSGFEAINLFFFFGLLVAAEKFFEKPEVIRYEWLFILGLCASQCRYETMVVLLPIGLLGIYHIRSFIDENPRWHFWTMPLLSLPILWQRLIMGTRGLQLETKRELFSVSNFFENLMSAFTFLLNGGDKTNASSPVVFALATMGVCLFLYHWFKNGRSSEPVYKALGFIFVCLLLVIAVQYSYSEGNLLLPADTRLGVVLTLFLGVSAAYFLNALSTHRGWQAVSYSVVFFIFSMNLATAALNEKGKALLLFREYEEHLRFLKSYDKGHTLIVSDRPGLYAIQLYGAVDFGYMQRNYDEIQHGIERHLYRDVLVIQFVHYRDQKATPELDSRYHLTPVYEYQNSAEYFVRISKIS